MAQFIDREQLLKALSDYVSRSNHSDYAPTPQWNDAVRIVDNFPTFDAVPMGFHEKCMQIEIAKRFEIEEKLHEKDCRKCVNYESCPCGKRGHENGTSIGYSIGECQDYKTTS